MFRNKRPGRNEGQALVEMVVVLPVLLLLLLAAAEMGKLFVISGKSEISARYIALSHFREAPFGDAYLPLTAGQEIESLFFNDALDDSGLPGGLGSEPDDPDVTYQELGDDELIYAPLDLGNELLILLWDYINATDDLLPIQGARSTFTYDLPFFPFGREHPLEETQDLQDAMSEGRLAARYDATGNFVMLTHSFSGQHGEEIRLVLEAAHLIVGAEITAPGAVAILAILWLIFLP